MSRLARSARVAAENRARREQHGRDVGLPRDRNRASSERCTHIVCYYGSAVAATERR